MREGDINIVDNRKKDISKWQLQLININQAMIRVETIMKGDEWCRMYDGRVFSKSGDVCGGGSGGC